MYVCMYVFIYLWHSLLDDGVICEDSDNNDDDNDDVAVMWVDSDDHDDNDHDDDDHDDDNDNNIDV